MNITTKHFFSDSNSDKSGSSNCWGHKRNSILDLDIKREISDSDSFVDCVVTITLALLFSTLWSSLLSASVFSNTDNFGSEFCISSGGCFFRSFCINTILIKLIFFFFLRPWDEITFSTIQSRNIKAISSLSSFKWDISPVTLHILNIVSQTILSLNLFKWLELRSSFHGILPVPTVDFIFSFLHFHWVPVSFPVLLLIVILLIWDRSFLVLSEKPFFGFICIPKPVLLSKASIWRSFTDGWKPSSFLQLS